MRRAKVLVVEDEPAVGGVLEYSLSRAGWLVELVRSGEAAVERVRTERIDAILCDLDLGPGLGGLDLLSILRDAGIRTPVIILTAHGTVERCKDALRLGAAEFLEKPSSPAEVLAVLGRVTGFAVSPNGTERNGTERAPTFTAMGSICSVPRITIWEARCA